MRLDCPAVAITGMVLFLIGGGWYMLFGRQWSAVADIPASQVVSGSAYFYVVAFVAALLAAYALARVSAWYAHPSVVAVAMVGFLLDLLIFAPLTLTDYSLEQRSFTLFLVNAGYVVVGLIIGGAMLGAWQPKRKYHGSHW